MLIQLGDNIFWIFFSEIEETARSTTTVPKKNRVSAGKRPTTGQETTQRRQTRVRNSTFWSITTQFSQSAKHEKMRRLEFLWAAQALLSSLALLLQCIFCISSCYLTFCIKYLQIRTTKTTTFWAKTKRQDRLFIAQRGCDARFFVTD